MKRLIKSYRSIEMNQEIQDYFENNDDRFDNEYINIAKKIIQKIRILPTYERIYDLSQHIKNGKFDDLPDINKNLDLWVERAENILKENKILLSQKIYTFEECINNNLQYDGYVDNDSKYENSNFIIKKVNISNLNINDLTNKQELDIDLYLNEGISDDYDIEQIGELVKLIDDNVDLEPIIINKNNEVIDGYHRCWAYIYCGINTIEAYTEI